MPLKKLTTKQKNKRKAMEIKKSELKNQKELELSKIVKNVEPTHPENIENEAKAEIKDNLVARGINFQDVDGFTKTGQTYPPTKRISELYPDKNFPVGELMDHPLERNANRKTSKTFAEKEKKHEDILRDCREAGEIHRQVRQYIQRVIKPGMRMIDICELLENKNRELIGINEDDYLSRGIGFPTGVSLNNVAAHYTPNSNDNTVLKQDDIVKIDFGTQVNGRIIDCAFTATFDEKYDKFTERVKEATNVGIRQMGVDVRLCDIGKAISEVLEGEVEIGDKLVETRPIRNLNGHSIGPWKIHAGKTVPLYDNKDVTKMEEGELYAIETFISTGSGRIQDSTSLEDSHFMKNFDAPFVNFDRPATRQLLNFINKNYGTLAFCRRWIDNAGISRHGYSLKNLVEEGVIEAYPALEDKKGSLTAQFEHTIYLRPTCKEVVSRGVDY